MNDVSKPMELITPYLDCGGHDHDTWTGAEKRRADCNTEILAAVEQAIRLSNAEAVVSVLEQLPCDAMPELYSMCLTRDPDHRWQWCDNCSALAVWKAEVARLQGDA